MTVGNFAHRGARSLAPENTLPALRKAWELGVDGVEIDIGVSRDGELILMHDSLLGRTTNVAEQFPDRADQPFTAFRFAELQELDAGSWFLDTDPFAQIRAGRVSFAEMQAMQETRIPLLRDVLRYGRDKQWRLNLELKKMVGPMADFPLAQAVIELIYQEAVEPGQIIISSFEHDNLRLVQNLAPELEVQALIGDNYFKGNNWGSYEFQIYNANAAYIDAAQIAAARSHGCTVNLYTVNSVEDMQRSMSWGVHTLITDFPQILAGLLTAPAG